MMTAAAAASSSDESMMMTMMIVTRKTYAYLHTVKTPPNKTWNSFFVHSSSSLLVLPPRKNEKC